MKNINVCLLAVVACTYSLQATAGFVERDLNFAIESNVFSLRDSLDKSHKITPLELNPILNSKSGIKLAAVCAVGKETCNGITFGSNDDDLDLDRDNQCLEAGYNLTSCPDTQTPENLCPYDSKYFRDCKCPSYYKYYQSSCSSQFPNSTLGDEQCVANGMAFSNSCVCNVTNYPYTASTCNGKEELSGTKCKSNSGITYASDCTCIGGDEKYQHTDASCKSSHSDFANWTMNDDVCQNKASDCVCSPTSSCLGYTLDSDTCGGGSKIGESCNNGCQMKWKCKDLCPNEGKYTSNSLCPYKYTCSLEGCSGKWYETGCSTNYNNWCGNPETNCKTLGYDNRPIDSCPGTGAFVECPFDPGGVRFCLDRKEAAYTCSKSDDTVISCANGKRYCCPSGYVGCTYAVPTGSSSDKWLSCKEATKI